MKKDSSSSDAIKMPVAKQYFNQFQNMNDFEKIMNMWINLFQKKIILLLFMINDYSIFYFVSNLKINKSY